MKSLMVIALLACLAVVVLGQVGGGIGAISGGGSGGGSLVNQMKAMQALSGRTQGSGMGMGLDLPMFAMLHASGNDQLRMWYFCSRNIWLCMWAENRY